MGMESGRLTRQGGPTLAWRRLPGRAPAVMFLPGYRSDMGGAKATEIAAWCEGRGQALMLFDYSGHGESAGAFEDGSIGAWTADALAIIDYVAPVGPLLLVGSSMGGWIALLAAIARPERVRAMLLIAAAPDFTESLMWASMMPDERSTLLRVGRLMAPSAYGDPYPITLRLIEEGRDHLLLTEGAGKVPVTCPVRLLHGQRDPDVPWETSLRLAARLAADDVRLTLIKDGDHRLSRPADLALLRGSLAALCAEDGA
jgi:pimeloyl-ACP methyl ester carboxylesterase